MAKFLGILLLSVGLELVALAGPRPPRREATPNATVPEIDTGMACSALALLTGAALVIRGRRRS